MKKFLAILFSIFIVLLSAKAQKDEAAVTFAFENTSLQSDDLFAIVVTMPNSRKKEVSNFPEIPDFIKKNTHYNKEGKIFTIRQTYKARKTGVFILNPFIIKINDVIYKSVGATIKANSVSKENKNITEEDSKFISSKEDAFLKIACNKNEIYTGEQIVLSAALYISKDNKAEMNFIDFKQQVGEIIKNIKPENCWAENLTANETIEKDTVFINHKSYSRYMIYVGKFYPYTTAPINLASQKLQMLKYKIYKSKNLVERVEDYFVLKSIPLNIKVKNLPGDAEVAVGEYSLEEKVSSNTIRIGESVSYEFIIKGAGNIQTIEAPMLKENNFSEIYNSGVNEKIISKNTKAKIFSFHILIKEPGVHKLSDYFAWTYFNVEKKQYETLIPKITVRVEGEKKKNNYLSYSDLGSFYRIIEVKSNRLRNRKKNETIKFLANIIIALMLGTTIFLIIKR